MPYKGGRAYKLERGTLLFAVHIRKEALRLEFLCTRSLESFAIKQQYHPFALLQGPFEPSTGL